MKAIWSNVMNLSDKWPTPCSGLQWLLDLLQKQLNNRLSHRHKSFLNILASPYPSKQCSMAGGLASACIMRKDYSTPPPFPRRSDKPIVLSWVSLVYDNCSADIAEGCGLWWWLTNNHGNGLASHHEDMYSEKHFVSQFYPLCSIAKHIDIICPSISLSKFDKIMNVQTGKQTDCFTVHKQNSNNVKLKKRYLRMLPTVFEEKAENYFKSMFLRNKTLNRHRKPLSYYVSQSDNRTYNTAPLNTVKSILKNHMSSRFS